MLPLIDMHCHLLAGLDDGPGTDEEALAMCRLAYADGIRTAAATAHQNEEWAEVTPERIRSAAGRLAAMLREAAIPLAVFPCAEVMIHADLRTAWRQGALQSVAGRGQYLLVEMPHGLCLDIGDLVRGLQQDGVRPILAHPERHAELLHEPGAAESLIAAGCLIQVSSGSVTDPPGRADGRALRDWFKRGVVHFLGSDAHSTRRRRPALAAAYRQVALWAGSAVADRVCSTNGTAVAHGLPLRVPAPEVRPRRWFPCLW
jgi:protein-tyrosine phosphatase